MSLMLPTPDECGFDDPPDSVIRKVRECLMRPWKITESFRVIPVGMLAGHYHAIALMLEARGWLVERESDQRDGDFLRVARPPRGTPMAIVRGPCRCPDTTFVSDVCVKCGGVDSV